MWSLTQIESYARASARWASDRKESGLDIGPRDGIEHPKVTGITRLL